MPSLALLVREMAAAREGLTLAEVSRRSHYSVSALSGVTSGVSIPTADLIAAYAQATGRSVDTDRWLTLRQAALKERKAGKTTTTDDDGNGGVGAPSLTRPAPNSPATPDSGRTLTLLPLSIARIRTARREADMTAHATAPSADNTHMASLVLEAMESAERTNAPIHVDPVTGALSLCTMPRDFMELLRTLRGSSGVTFDRMECDVQGYGVSLSRSTLVRIMSSDQLPQPNVLAAILEAFSVPQDKIDVWLYHRARLEIADVRHAGRHTPPGKASRRPRMAVLQPIPYGYARVVPLLIAAVSLLVAVLPLILR
ncbi:helix-turn-helix transcriptional regulator [Streptomyces sp. ISL-44]|uniref:helix-turn-helix domain-containing protein n=1 Tax=Streptomyces sp. ISL-44 TaxID=2819184 RepID=UPI001BE53F34|nr:helix-turn-helix transcriptional regulator [Streptomyces sp. ISL-44]MBT2539768.1 helix-turn-helix transcriptional regulator [Streptomyces sp. ISL-44]